jgi:hypothetical protein
VKEEIQASGAALEFGNTGGHAAVVIVLRNKFKL